MCIRDRDSGSPLWRDLDAARSLVIGPGSPSPRPPQDNPEPATSLVISHSLGGGCRWHPPTLWLGIGCERGTSLSVLERLVERTLAEAHLAPDAVAGLASIDRKRDEPALLDLARKRDWPLRWFEAVALRQVAVPHPSEVVEQSMGTPSVAEASSLLAASAASRSTPTAADLLVGKSLEHARPGEVGAATLAVSLAEQQWAPERGEIHLVGSGPGRLDLLTADARRALARCTVWLGYGPYLELLEPLRRSDQLRREGHLTEERTRCRDALDLAIQGTAVALISSGDSGIYGMAGLALELWLALDEVDRPDFTVHPGLSAVQLAAARAGAPLMHDFCTISLSDRLTPWEVIERRLQAAANGDFVVALYNPRSSGRHWQLDRARELLLEHRPGTTPVLLARQLGRTGEHTSLHTLTDLPSEAVDMLSLVLVGNTSTRLQEGKMVTPRGYPGAELEAGDLWSPKGSIP